MSDFCEEIAAWTAETAPGGRTAGRPFPDFPECMLLRCRDISGRPVGILAVPAPSGEQAHDLFAARLRGEGILYGVSLLRDAMEVTVIYEDLWRMRNAVARGRILVLLGLFRKVMARDCRVARLDSAVCGSFIDRCHSYGNTGSKYRYGLFLDRDRPCLEAAGLHKGDLVAAATFSGGRRWMKPQGEVHSYEWIRYASLPDVRVNGGMTKILKHFTEEVSPDDIMTYADLESSGGSSYPANGFDAEGLIPPQGYIVADKGREPLKRLSESQVREALEASPGSYLIFNLGSRKYRLTIA